MLYYCYKEIKLYTAFLLYVALYFCTHLALDMYTAVSFYNQSTVLYTRIYVPSLS